MSKANRRFYRSLIISIAALGVLIGVSFDQFDVSRQEALVLIGTTVLMVAAVILLAAAFAALWTVLRRRSRRDQRD